jgi:hypothetical protein
LSPLPVLNLIEITAEECKKKGFKKVTVLGTESTMKGGLYNEELRKRGIEPVIPVDQVCKDIQYLIMDEIIPSKIILDVYRQSMRSNNFNLSDIRGTPIPIYNDYVWDESACGSNLIIEDNGKVVQALDKCNSSVRANMILDNKGIFEWDVIIEKDCELAWVGVCASENFNYGEWAGDQPTGWVLGSNGYCQNSRNRLKYCQKFRDGAKVTIHLDMNKRTCAFTVNGIRYPEVSNWNNLPSKLYPVVSLCYPGRIRIQPHLIGNLTVRFILLCDLCYYCASILFKKVNEKVSEFLMKKFILLLINILILKVASEYIKIHLLYLGKSHSKNIFLSTNLKESYSETFCP